MREGHLPLAEREVSDLILRGYLESLASGGKPFVAGTHHRWLAVPRGSAAGFWHALAKLPALTSPELPDDAVDALRELAAAGRLAADAAPASRGPRQSRPSPRGRSR